MSKVKKQKTEKQIFRKWVVVMVIAFLAGLIGAEPIRQTIERLTTWTSEINMELMLYLALGLFALMNVIGILVTYISYKKAKKMTEQWDGNNEDVLDKIEDKLDVALLSITITISTNYFFFGLISYIGLVKMEGQGMLPPMLTLVGIVVFLGSSLVFVALQKKCIDLTKQLNPEKKGNIFDKNFSKEWLASCDEAQQLIIYKSSFAAYKNAGGACQILWLVTVIAMMTLDTGLLPIFCVSVIMLVMQVSYYLESKKLERGKK